MKFQRRAKPARGAKTAAQWMARLALPAFVLLAIATNSLAAEATPDKFLDEARAAFEKGDVGLAFSLANRAIQLDSKNARAYEMRGRLHDGAREIEKAIQDFSQVIRLNPTAAPAYLLRGSANFKAGKIHESIADFDRLVELAPGQAPYLWQRGISYYYAGRYEDGRKQFESHQTVNANDVENAVWHFLCVARLSGPDQARASLIPIRGDRRVPMMQVFALFAGNGSADDVMAATRAGEPSASELKQRLFYAHLYLGLYYEAVGNSKRSEEHIATAAGEFAQEHYMGDVARVHLKLRKEAPPKNE